MFDNWIYAYLYCFAVPFLLTLAAVPCCMKLAWKTGYLDVPKSEGHKLHGNATPLLGGLAMCAAWTCSILGGIAAVKTFAPSFMETHLAGFHSSVPELVSIVSGACASMILGVIDDRFPMKASVKFAGQLVIALAVVIFGGIRITLFMDSAFFSCAVTVFWFLFMFNAMNFFDNMDGLAAGTAAIAFVFFLTASIVNGQYFVACLSACSAAAAMGFWIFNSSPAKIFMGDAGSHFLAFLLAVIAAKVTYYNPDIASTKFAVLIPLFVLAVPIFDTFAVVVIRLKNHKPVYVGDHNHISHRFLHMGMSRKRAVQMVHLLVLIGALGALPLLWGDIRTCVVLILQGCTILLLLSLMQYAGIQALREEKEKSAAAEKSIKG